MTIELDWQWPFGDPVSEPDQPLAMQRALHSIFDKGKPQGAVRWLFFQPNRAHPGVLWFGALLLSRGERVIFFPSSVIPGFSLHRLGVEQPVTDFEVDHVSLESDWSSWHLTGTNRRHQGGPRTVPLESNGVLWFGMNSAGPEAMHRVKGRSLLRFEVPEADASRRWQLLKDVRNDSVDQILTLNERAFEMSPPWSVQFNFLVGEPGFRPQGKETARFHVTEEDLPPEGEEIRRELPAREHRIRLSNEVEVIVVTFPVPGEPRVRWSLMGWA